MIYAARYARGDVGHGLQLLAIYAAYFAARTAALPVVVSRASGDGATRMPAPS